MNLKKYSIRWFISPCALNVSGYRDRFIERHLNDLTPAPRQSVNCTQSDGPGTARTQYSAAEPHWPPACRGERGQFGVGDATLGSDHDQ